MTDTELRGITKWALIGLAVAAAFFVPLPVVAESPRSRVILARSGHAYVALAGGERVEEGDSVRFEDRGKPIAGGRVATVVHDEMAVVALTSGTFQKTKKLERVRVFMSRPPISRRAMLRIGIPTGDNLLFRCLDMTARLPTNAPNYLSERTDWFHIRMTRDNSATDGLWPDTLLVFLFEDPRDEEIALERGDVDVGVFWPGQLSSRMRQEARWSGFPMGRRSRGVLALTGAEHAAGGAPDSAEAVALNDAIFRGDLIPQNWGSIRGVLRNIDVDEDLPARIPIRNHLGKGNTVVLDADIPGARLTFADVSADTAASMSFRPVFRIRCPVVCAAPLRPLVNALGADAFADMPQCSQRPAEESHR
jgi:hypothetical protein